MNLLSGRTSELVPALAGHREVNAVVDGTLDPRISTEVDELAAETVKRVVRIRTKAPASSDERLRRLVALTEVRTAWHPIGA